MMVIVVAVDFVDFDGDGDDVVGVVVMVVLQQHLLRCCATILDRI